MKKYLSLFGVFVAAVALVSATTTDSDARRKKKKKRPIPTEVELTTAIGTKGDFAPELFKGLKAGMSPGEVKDIFDRMGRVTTYGYAKAKVKGHAGVWFLRFHFDKDEDTQKREKLHSAHIVYKKKLRKNPEFFERMTKLAQAKWGPASNAGQVARKIVTWTDDSKKKVVQFARYGDQFELSYEP